MIAGTTAHRGWRETGRGWSDAVCLVEITTAAEVIVRFIEHSLDLQGEQARRVGCTASRSVQPRERHPRSCRQ